MNRILEIVTTWFLQIFIAGIFVGAIFYSANQLNNAIKISEILFWCALILIFVTKTFYISKEFGFASTRKQE